MSSTTPLPPVPPEPALPTQSAHPGRASARTLVQNVLGYLIGGGLVVAAIAGILREELGEFIPENVLAVIVAVGVVGSTVATLASRIMAIPQVDRWLEHVALSSRPKVGAAAYATRAGGGLRPERKPLTDPHKAPPVVDDEVDPDPYWEPHTDPRTDV